MEKQHRELINNNMSDLVYFTSNVEAIVNNLLEKNIINKWMKDYVLRPKETKLQKRNLYKVIQGRGPKAFSALCRTLEDTSNITARNIILSSKSSIETTEYKSDDLLNNEISNIDLNNVKPYVKIHPQRRRMDVNDENLPIRAYPMGSNPKGYALILNINKIINKEERTGSNVDVASLMQLFKGLGYVIDLKVDSTEKELKEIIKQFVENCNKAKIDSIVVFIMSHGEAGKDSTRSSDILTADGVRFNTDWLVEQFEPNKSKRNVPKLFFVQACRGGNSDHGWKSFDNGNNQLQNDSTTTTINSSIGHIVNRRYENVFIANATVPGYNAKRDPVEGSWFVQKLCEVISENAWELDLNSMMKMVDTEVRKLNSVEHGFQTTEWTYRGFNKKFYFNPGLYDDNSDQ